MKFDRRIGTVLTALAIFLMAAGANAQRQMEKLGRGVIALRTDTTNVYVGWRLLGTDPDDIGFNLYRVTGGTTNKLNAQPLTNTTDYVDPGANLALTNAWFVRPVLGGTEQATSIPFSLPSNAPVRQYLSIPLHQEAGDGKPDGISMNIPDDPSLNATISGSLGGRAFALGPDARGRVESNSGTWSGTDILGSNARFSGTFTCL